MDFTYTEDQLVFQQSVREFLVNEVTCDKIRSLWSSESGRSDALWQQFAEMGLTAMTVPEAQGGLGLNLVDFILLAQECGYVALPANLVETVMVSVPLLSSLENNPVAESYLEKIASGEVKVSMALSQNLLVEDAHIADVIIAEKDGSLYALSKRDFEFIENESVDPSRKIFSVSWDPANAILLAEGEKAATLIKTACQSGALASAAQCIGLTQRMIDLSVQYTSDRTQFGKPIGSFQAVKHRLANVAVELEYAKAPVAFAAYALTHDLSNKDRAVSQAKIMATKAALTGAKNAIQVHGAMGYTWEVDLHIFMKKAWVLDKAWGDQALHKACVASSILESADKIGAGYSFN